MNMIIVYVRLLGRNTIAPG